MRRQRDVEHLAAARRIDHRDRARAVADQHAVDAGIDADVVGVRAEIEPAGLAVLRAVVEAHRAVARIGDEQEIERRQVADALRVAQPADAVHHLARRDVDHADAVVAELGDEQPMMREVERHVVDAADHLAERDFGFELQRLGRRGGAACGGERERQDARQIKDEHRDWTSVHAQSPRHASIAQNLDGTTV